MIREFAACYPFFLKEAPVQKEALDFIPRERLDPPRDWPELAQVTDDWARLDILTQAIATKHKEQARVGARRQIGGYRYWLQRDAPAFLKRQREYLEDLHLIPEESTLPDITGFPPGSWLIHFAFRLATPYFSKDDTEWYIVDNPMRKEWVFKVPYIAPSQWKGALRAAMRAERGYATWEEEDDDPQMRRLFGNVKGEEENFQAGCLYFYPTFFDRLGLEVINPHSRRTGAGTRPIYLECVPAGAEGTFTLLYVPLTDDADPEADLRATAAGIQAMMTRYGFGAKTSSGFGKAQKDLCRGELRLNGKRFSFNTLDDLLQKSKNLIRRRK